MNENNTMNNMIDQSIINAAVQQALQQQMAQQQAAQQQAIQQMAQQQLQNQLAQNALGMAGMQQPMMGMSQQPMMQPAMMGMQQPMMGMPQQPMLPMGMGMGMMAHQPTGWKKFEMEHPMGATALKVGGAVAAVGAIGFVGYMVGKKVAEDNCCCGAIGSDAEVGLAAVNV